MSKKYEQWEENDEIQVNTANGFFPNFLSHLLHF